MFYDDGYAQYSKPNEVYRICEQSECVASFLLLHVTARITQEHFVNVYRYRVILV
jgi:hypothetical protein